jgi:hypothetical protein
VRTDASEKRQRASLAVGSGAVEAAHGEANAARVDIGERAYDKPFPDLSAGRILDGPANVRGELRREPDESFRGRISTREPNGEPHESVLRTASQRIVNLQQLLLHLTPRPAASRLEPIEDEFVLGAPRGQQGVRDQALAIGERHCDSPSIRHFPALGRITRRGSVGFLRSETAIEAHVEPYARAIVRCIKAQQVIIGLNLCDDVGIEAFVRCAAIAREVDRNTVEPEGSLSLGRSQAPGSASASSTAVNRSVEFI